MKQNSLFKIDKRVLHSLILALIVQMVLLTRYITVNCAGKAQVSNIERCAVGFGCLAGKSLPFVFIFISEELPLISHILLNNTNLITNSTAVHCSKNNLQRNV